MRGALASASKRVGAQDRPGESDQLGPPQAWRSILDHERPPTTAPGVAVVLSPHDVRYTESHQSGRKGQLISQG
jgi:hypothetical protein